MCSAAFMHSISSPSLTARISVRAKSKFTVLSTHFENTSNTSYDIVLFSNPTVLNSARTSDCLTFAISAISKPGDWIFACSV